VLLCKRGEEREERRSVWVPVTSANRESLTVHTVRKKAAGRVTPHFAFKDATRVLDAFSFSFLLSLTIYTQVTHSTSRGLETYPRSTWQIVHHRLLWQCS